MKLFATFTKWLVVIVYAACAVVIVASVVPIGGWKALDVLTGSMRPSIQPGDLVIIHHLPLRQIHPGDIVTYTNPAKPGQTITHRVVSMPVKDGLQMVITKGDANPAADPPFAGGRIVGREVLHIPYIGKLLNLLHNPLVVIVLVVIPGLLVIWSEITILRRSLSLSDATPKQNKSGPPDADPPATPPPAAPQSHQRPVPGRRLDGMGPRMVWLMLLAAIPVGFTYASASTNHVFAHGKVVVLAAPASAGDCKNGGWQKYKNPDGSQRFKNQGQCVAFVNSNSHSHVSNVTNVTNITVMNQTTQTTTTGNVRESGNTAGPTLSGDAANTNSTATTAGVQ